MCPYKSEHLDICDKRLFAKWELSFATKALRPYYPQGLTYATSNKFIYFIIISYLYFVSIDICKWMNNWVI